MLYFYARSLTLFVTVWQLWVIGLVNEVRTHELDVPAVEVSLESRSLFCHTGYLNYLDVIIFSVKVPRLDDRFRDEVSVTYKLGKGDSRALLCIIDGLRSVHCHSQSIIGCYCSAETYESSTITVNVSARHYDSLNAVLVEKTGKTLEFSFPEYEIYDSPIMNVSMDGETLPVFGLCSVIVESDRDYSLLLSTKGLLWPELIVEIEGQGRNVTMVVSSVSLSQYLEVGDYVARFSYKDGCQRERSLTCSIKTVSPMGLWQVYYPWILPLVTGIIVLPTFIYYYSAGKFTYDTTVEDNIDQSVHKKSRTSYLMPFM